MTLVVEAPVGFHVHLPAFEGPFDLLLNLIGKHKLDVTEIALAAVTDEFLTYSRGLEAWDLGQATEFLVVASTLLDLKIARLLPSQTPLDDEDLALLEARDLLFARLLQYRAYKQAAGLFGALLEAETRFRWRTIPLEPWLAAVLPEVTLDIDLARLAELAARALAPRAEPVVGVAHIHAPAVSVAELAERAVQRLGDGPMAFRVLTADAASLLEVVGTFLALLELFRAGRVSFEQAEALGELQVRLIRSAEPAESPETTADAPTTMDEYDDAGPSGPEQGTTNERP